MLRFETRAERGCRSYREIVAQGQGERDRSAACPACGYPLTGITGDQAPAAPVLPDRGDDAGREARRTMLATAATRLAEQLRDQVPPGTFAIWLAPLVLDDATTDAIYLAAPAPLVSWLADRYMPLLQRAAHALAGRPIHIELYPAAPDSAAATLGDLLADQTHSDVDAAEVAA